VSHDGGTESGRGYTAKRTLNQSEQNRKLRLVDTKSGDLIEIEEFLAPFCDIETRICSMGLNKGEVARVVSNSFLSPVLLDIYGTKIAISKTEAKKIKVKLISKGS
jgi:Fe2+ transport system protein FeoA